MINFNKIDNDCDDEVIKKHDDVSIGIDDVGLIQLTLSLNFGLLDMKELDMFIVSKWRYW